VCTCCRGLPIDLVLEQAPSFLAHLLFLRGVTLDAKGSCVPRDTPPEPPGALTATPDSSSRAGHGPARRACGPQSLAARKQSQPADAPCHEASRGRSRGAAGAAGAASAAAGSASGAAGAASGGRGRSRGRKKDEAEKGAGVADGGP